MAPKLMHLGIVGLLDSVQRFRCQCAGDIGGLGKLNRIVNRKAADGSHDLSAVDKRKPFLRGKLHGGNAGFFHSLFAAHQLTLIFGPALAYHDEHHM